MRTQTLASTSPPALTGTRIGCDGSGALPITPSRSSAASSSGLNPSSPPRMRALSSPSAGDGFLIRGGVALSLNGHPWIGRRPTRGAAGWSTI